MDLLRSSLEFSEFLLPMHFSYHLSRGCWRLSYYNPVGASGAQLLYHAISTITESKCLSESPESPELPSWVKFCENENSATTDSEDDFVPPNISDWAKSRKLYDRHRKYVKDMPSVIMEGNIDKISKLLENGLENVKTSDFKLSGGLVEKLLKRFSNDWVRSHELFTWAKSQAGHRHSVNCYNMIVDILGKAKKFGLMWEVVEEMHQLEEGFISMDTMGLVMRRLARAGKWDDAIDVLRKMDHFGLSKDIEAMNMLMDALVKGHSVEHAQKAFLEFRGEIAPNSHTFNILINGWCRARKMDEAKKAMAEMEKHGFYPDTISYTCFIAAYSQVKDFRQVDALLDEMGGKLCYPGVVTYTVIMLALAKAKEMNEALNVYEKMKKNGCVPDASFYSAFIFMLNKFGRFKDAYDIFKDMPKQNVTPDLLTYNTMIASACMHSLEEEALELLLEMEVKSCKPDIKTYTPLLRMCCRKKRMKVLHFLLNDMFQKDVSIDLGTYTLLVHELLKSGKLEHACSYFEELILKGMTPMEKTYSMLSEKLEKKGMVKAKQQIEKLMGLPKMEDKPVGIHV